MQVPARPPAAAAMAGATIDKLSGGRFLFGFGPSGPAGLRRLVRGALREALGTDPRVHRGGAGDRRPRRARSNITATHYDLPLGGGEGKALKLNFHPLRNADPGLRRLDRPQIGADDRRSRRRLDPDLLLGRPLRRDLGGAPRGGLRGDRADPRRPRGLALALLRDRRRPGGGAEHGQGRAASSTSAGWGRGRRTSTSIWRTASASATSPTRSSGSFRADDRGGAFAAIPDELVATTSLIGTEAEVADRVARFAAAGVDRLIVSPAHLEPDQRAHTLERLAAVAGVGPTD